MKFKKLVKASPIALALATAACGVPDDPKGYCGYQPGNDSRVVCMQESEDPRSADKVTDVGYYSEGLETASDGADSYSRGYPVVKDDGYGQDGQRKFSLSFRTVGGRVQLYKDEAGKPTSVVVQVADSSVRYRFDQARVNRTLPEFVISEGAAQEADPMYTYDLEAGREPSDKAKTAMEVALHNYRFEGDEAPRTTSRAPGPAGR